MIDNLISKKLFSVISIDDFSIRNYIIDKRDYIYEHTNTSDLTIISDNSQKKQQLLYSFDYQKDHQLHKATVFKLDGVKFKISKGGFVIFRNSKVLLESCNHEGIYFTRYFPKIELKIKLFRLDSLKLKHTIVLEHNLDFNYWHLHAELIPQLGLIIKIYFTEIKEKISVVIGRNFPNAYRDMLLGLFGRYISLVENINGKILSECIYVTSQMYSRMLHNSSKFIQSRNLAFWDSMNDFKPNLLNPDLIYDVVLISRAKATSRRLLNENDLVKVLKEHGITVNVFCLEEYAWLDQLSILNSAKVILSPHGAHSVSLLYIQPPLYIEIVSFDRDRGLFPIMDVENICQFRGIRVLFVDSGVSSDQSEDYKISLNQQNQILNLIKDEINR